MPARKSTPLQAVPSPVTELDPKTCQSILTSQSIGRMALTQGNTVDIIVVRYVLTAGKIYFQSNPSDIFSSIVVSRQVVFEVDRAQEACIQSVIVQGSAHWYPYDPDIDPLLLKQARVASGHTMQWVEIVPHTMSGRELTIKTE